MATDENDAVEFMRFANDANSDNYARGAEALRFRYGEQWPQYAVASRGLDRPQLTINETNTYIKKVCNQQRQMRPRGKASPVDSLADPKVAKVITGLGRHCEVNSDADNAYDTAFDFAATIGWGFWRIRTDYISEDSFNQDVFIDCIANPFSVSFDPNSKLPDGSDAECALITDLMKIETFKKEYPGAQPANFQTMNPGDNMVDWITDHDIRIAEFFKVDRKAEKLIMLSDGQPHWEDEVKKAFESGLLAANGLTVVGDRDSFKRIVKWVKQTGAEVLEENTLPGRWIPIVPVYWTRVKIDGKDIMRGLVYDAMDPQRMVNFWQTSITETIALAPKAKWLVPEGADEGHENEYAQANLAARPVLHYKTTGVDGREIQPPQRVAPEMPPAGAIEAAFLSSQNLSRVMGVFDPAVRGGAQHKSDKTLNAEQGQSEVTNFDGYDNLVRSIKHSWRIMLSYFPVVYDTQRAARIIGADGREEIVTLNESQPDPTTGAIQKVLNDVTVGTYDVVMETGPGYDTQRKEGVVAMMELMNTPLGEKVAQIGDDLIVREMDFPGADVLADRLAAANPLSQIDEKIDIPPQVQMKLKQQEAQIQQLQGQLQAAGMEIKFKAGIADKDNETKLKIAHLNAVTKAHDTETWAAQDSKQGTEDNDTKVLVEQIQAHVALLLARIDERKEDARSKAESKEKAVE